VRFVVSWFVVLVGWKSQRECLVDIWAPKMGTPVPRFGFTHFTFYYPDSVLAMLDIKHFEKTEVATIIECEKKESEGYIGATYDVWILRTPVLGKVFLHSQFCPTHGFCKEEK
jgi:hypothetical protein